MDVLCPSDIFLFEDFWLDGRGLFRRDETGAFVPVKIGSRSLDVLRILVERDGVLSKDEILAAVWPGTVVEESNLTVQISALRRVLDGGRAESSCIRTVAGRGYSFVAPVTRKVVRGDLADGPSPPLSLMPDRLRSRPIGLLLAASLGIAVGFGGLAWSVWFPQISAIDTPAVASKAILGPADEKPPPRMSIVVLPFANMSNDPDQEYFADAMTDELTTDLSRISDSFVIARSTAFPYKAKSIDAKQVGRELEVRYVLEGSTRRWGNQARVNARLIDAETGAHLWADRFDGNNSDPFTLSLAGCCRCSECRPSGNAALST